jgi:phosphoribosylamine--glycine ligase
VKVLLVGGGGREHALAWALARSPDLTALIAAPGNPGIARHARCVAVSDTALDEQVALARRELPDLVVVGPEAPLAAGLGDRLREAGFPVFGPSAAAARIESSKAFAKELMARAGVPTARFEVFDALAPAQAWCRRLGAPLVVKADGLAAGKGAIVCATLEEADRALALCLEERAFGDSGRRVVVEEFMVGEEVSFFALSDGEATVACGVAQDHKTIFDGDRGPNTGGMGAYAPVPAFDAGTHERAMAEIVRPTIAALGKADAPYRGALYAGLMLTREGPRVVEFNCRFGDPECQVLLPRLADDLLPLLDAVARGRGLPPALRWREQASVCVVAASGGYPGPYETGRVIRGLDPEGGLPGANVFHAGTARRDGTLVTAGGRVLGVQAQAPGLREAIEHAYEAVGRIAFEGMHVRRDVGAKGLAR